MERAKGVSGGRKVLAAAPRNSIRMLVVRRAFAYWTLVIVGLGGCSDPKQLRIVPAIGDPSGGQSVRIQGSDFAIHGPPVVYFGRSAARAVVVESSTLIRVSTPRTDLVGLVDVRVVFRDGTIWTVPEGFSVTPSNGISLLAEPSDP